MSGPPGQRCHDALADAAGLLLASDGLPPAGGTPATVLLTMTVDQLETRTGIVTTAHGGTMSVPAALELAGQASVIPVVLDSTGILAYGQARRTATIGQRLALAARDRGCCFPGCDAPPGWTQVHHVIEWNQGGRTDLDNQCLLCGYHHRTFDKRGWQVAMRDSPTGYRRPGSTRPGPRFAIRSTTPSRPDQKHSRAGQPG